jgi:signal transduction histidine kinase
VTPSRVLEARGQRLDRVLVAVLVALIVVSAAALLVPAFAVHIFAPGLDVTLDAVTTMVCAGVATLAWIRFSDRGEPIALFQVSAFLVLVVANAVALVLVLASLEGLPGVSGEAIGVWPLWVAALSRLAAALLLVAGGIASLRHGAARHPSLVALGPAFGVLLLVVVAASISPVLPPLSDSFAPIRGGADVSIGSTPSGNLLGLLARLPAFALFLWAAALSRRLYVRDGNIGEASLAVGLLFAAFAQSGLALYPGTYPGVVAGGDLLRLAFDVTLLLGIEAATRATVGALREANRELERLKDAEADRAVLEERARLSRELHDGLAQDLWIAKLKVGRLAALPDLGPDAMALTDELDDAIDAGLAEARQAVMATRYGGEAGPSFCELMARFVDDFADRFGLRAEFSCGQDLPPLAHRVEAELLRIAQEALTNVRRHADATFVRVQAAVDADSLTILVADNGRGFDPGTVGDSAYGLASMRERATLIGASLTVDSRPLDGTRIRVVVPLAAMAVPGAAPS